MVEKHGEQKKAWASLQGLGKCKAFKAKPVIWAVLCGKHLPILFVDEPVVWTADFICASGFNRHWYYEFLSDTVAEYLTYPPK